MRELIHLATERLLAPLMAPEQVASSHLLMSLDTQLIADPMYLAVERAGVLAGRGGWSRRATPRCRYQRPGGTRRALLDAAVGDHPLYRICGYRETGRGPRKPEIDLVFGSRGVARRR